MKRAAELLPTFDEPLFTRPVFVAAYFDVLKPKTTKLLTPRGDIDNYEKALYDALTKCGVWTDDTLVASHHNGKRFASRGLIHIYVKDL